MSPHSYPAMIVGCCLGLSTERTNWRQIRSFWSIADRPDRLQISSYPKKHGLPRPQFDTVGALSSLLPARCQPTEHRLASPKALIRNRYVMPLVTAIAMAIIVLSPVLWPGSWPFSMMKLSGHIEEGGLKFVSVRVPDETTIIASTIIWSGAGRTIVRGTMG